MELKTLKLSNSKLKFFRRQKFVFWRLKDKTKQELKTDLRFCITHVALAVKQVLALQRGLT